MFNENINNQNNVTPYHSLYCAPDRSLKLRTLKYIMVEISEVTDLSCSVFSPQFSPNFHGQRQLKWWEYKSGVWKTLHTPTLCNTRTLSYKYAFSLISTFFSVVSNNILYQFLIMLKIKISYIIVGSWNTCVSFLLTFSEGNL